MKQSLLAHYKEFLPIGPATPMLTLGEGDTPLVRSERLARRLGVGELYFKLEGCNPTGSFKDRGMVLAVAKAMEAGSTSVMCASTGNTSSSAAAYAARYGLLALVIVPGGQISRGKLVQALMYGARVLAVDANFDGALRLVRELTDKHPITLVNSLNPYRLEGQKTASFEIVDVLGESPDYLFLPVGNAGNISAYWKGFVEYQKAGRAGRRPHMMGFEAEGAAAIVKGAPIETPQTVASAIRIGDPASWKLAEAARDESGGAIGMVTDEQILAAYQALAAEEGIFVEPASAAGVAGLFKSVEEGLRLADQRVVCVLTGSGLKDADTAGKVASTWEEVPANVGDIERLLGW